MPPSRNPPPRRGEKESWLAKERFPEIWKGNHAVHVDKELAKLAGCSHDTISKVRLIQQKATAKQIESLTNGSASINQIYKEVRYAEEDRSSPAPALPVGKFSVILVESTMAIRFCHRSLRRRVKQLSDPDFRGTSGVRRECENLAAVDATLFLWSPAPKLQQAADLVRHWGFDYKSCWVWDKVRQNRGYYSSVRHELLLIAGRGRSTPWCDLRAVQSVDSVQSIPKTNNHSEKPEDFRKIIERLYPRARKVELFSRRKKVPGWTCWGNQCLD